MALRVDLSWKEAAAATESDISSPGSCVIDLTLFVLTGAGSDKTGCSRVSPVHGCRLLDNEAAVGSDGESLSSPTAAGDGKLEWLDILPACGIDCLTTKSASAPMMSFAS